MLLALLICPPRDFYPRSPCGERRKRPMIPTTPPAFLSTLSLRRATALLNFWIIVMIFLSTLSLRRATRGWTLNINGSMISIHALLAESDSPKERKEVSSMNFYPRSPCGERRPTKTCGCRMTIFLSTLSLRRATYWATRARAAQLFLSTLSLRRATPPRHWHGGVTGHFYPRSPCGERRCMSRKTPVQAAISIHALLAESDGQNTF